MKQALFQPWSILLYLLFILPAHAFTQPDTLMSFLHPLIGEWQTVADEEMKKNFPEMVDMIGFKFEWGDQRKKTIRFYEGVPKGDVTQSILETLVAVNPRTGSVNFMGYQMRNNFLFEGRFEPLQGGPGFVRLYKVYYPHGTQFRYKTDEMKGMKVYRDICQLIGKDTLECKTEQEDFGQWKSWGPGKPFRMIRKSIETPTVFENISFLIGAWELDLDKGRTARMEFEWGKNKRMIKFKNKFKPNSKSAFKIENEGIISYHAVKDKLVFMTIYTDEGDTLMAEGYFEKDADGNILRLFSCHYRAGETIPWSNGSTAPPDGKSVQFKQIWKPLDKNTIKADFLWKRTQDWSHPIKSYDGSEFNEVWKRVQK